MIRLLISILCALGLAFAPVAANAAATAAESMAGCTMGKEMPAKPANAKMDCCTPTCQAPSSTALLPDERDGGAVDLIKRVQLAWTPVKELDGITSSGLDPPPRA